MEATRQVPPILIYEEFDGHPIYRKGYKDVILGLKKINEISMGTSTLQWFITNIINRHLQTVLPPNYLCGPGELGLRLTKNTNFSADIAIFRPGQLKVGFQSARYSDVPPNVVIEII